MESKRHTTRWRVLLLLVLWAWSGGPAVAQDAHFAQMANAPLNLSPALTGAFDGDYRVLANFRRQVADVALPYLQMVSAFNLRFRNGEGEFTPWSGGLFISYDRVDGMNNLTQFGFSGGFAKPLSPSRKSYLSLGLMVGGMRRAFQPGELWLDDRYMLKEGPSPMIPDQEVLGENAKFLPDFSFGTSLHLQSENKRTMVDFGLGLFHLTEPKKDFVNGIEARLQTRYSVFILGEVELTERFDGLASLVSQFQVPHEETILGFGGRIHFSQKKTREMSLQFGVYYRPGGSLIPAGGLNYQTWRLQLSYDPTTPASDQVDRRRGGVELSAVYIFRQVPRTVFCKTCPTYM